MADIPLVNSLIIPQLPCSLDEVRLMNTEAFIANVTANPEGWMNCIQTANSYQIELAQICLQHETISAHRVTECGNLRQEADRLRTDLESTRNDLLETKNSLIAALGRPEFGSSFISSRHDQRSAKHPDPAMYGGAKEELEPFLTQLRAKLSLDADHFPNESDKIYYGVSRLEGDAMNIVMPHMKSDNTSDYSKVEDLMETLITAFGDPDKKGTAQRELRNLRQKNTDFASFVAQFRRWSPSTGFDDPSLTSFLSEAISSELKQAMISLEVPEKLTDYIALLQRLDNRIRALKNTNIRPPLTGPYRSTPTVSRPQMYTPSSSVVSTAIEPPLLPSDSASNLGHIPMDLSNARRGPVPLEEKLRRKALGICSYCGGVGHIASKCSLFKCYNCGGIGHAAQTCLKPKKLRVQETAPISILSGEKKSSLCI